MKRLYYDLETTGLKPEKHGIHQMSGKLVFDKDGARHVEEFNFKVRPNPKALIDEEALNIAGVTKEQVLSYPPMEVVFNQFISLLEIGCDRFNKSDKYHLVGYNNRGFDDQFLRGFFLQNNDNYFGSWFWSDSIDVMVLASKFFEEDRHKMPNFKLSTVASHLGIPIDENKLHDAMYDIYLTEEILCRIER